MRRRTWLVALGGVLAIAGALLAWDALVLTDEERLEELVEQLGGPLSRAKVRDATGRWVDLEAVPLEVAALGRTELYRAGEDAALRARADEGLARLYGDRLTVLSHTIEVDGDEATVTARVMGQRLGMMGATFDLRRDADAWRLTRVAVQR